MIPLSLSLSPIAVGFADGQSRLDSDWVKGRG